MSFFMTVIVAVKALRRNAMRTALTALGMIIGVAAVIVMVAIGTGARTSIENQIKSAGSNLVMVNAGSGGFGPVRQGQGAVTTLTADDAEAIAASRCRDSLPDADAEHAHADRRRDVELEHPGAGRQRRADRDSFLADAVRAASSPRRKCVSAAKVAVLGSVTRDQLFGAGARSGRRDDPHQQPAVPRHRRAHDEGAGRHGTRTRTTPS